MDTTVTSLAHLQDAIQRDPERWRPMVLTNGCFDILHAGHVDYLGKARNEGRSLVVGLNSDRSVRNLKGPQRPINTEMARATVLAALRVVDAVVVFEEKTATALVEALHPDIYVKGGDYIVESLPEAPAVQANGGRIVLIPFTWNLSTTALIARAQSG